MQLQALTWKKELKRDVKRQRTPSPRRKSAGSTKCTRKGMSPSRKPDRPPCFEFKKGQINKCKTSDYWHPSDCTSSKEASATKDLHASLSFSDKDKPGDEWMGMNAKKKRLNSEASDPSQQCAEQLFARCGGQPSAMSSLENHGKQSQTVPNVHKRQGKSSESRQPDNSCDKPY